MNDIFTLQDVISESEFDVSRNFFKVGTIIEILNMFHLADTICVRFHHCAKNFNEKYFVRWFTPLYIICKLLIAWFYLTRNNYCEENFVNFSCSVSVVIFGRFWLYYSVELLKIFPKFWKTVQASTTYISDSEYIEWSQYTTVRNKASIIWLK